jgi:hypothetical protein
MPLTANSLLNFSLGDYEEYPVLTNVNIFQGAAVSVNSSGWAKPLAAGETFVGFAEGVANNTGGATAAINVRVLRRGQVQLPVASLVVADNVGTAVYASADDTFTKTPTSNSLIGYTSRFISAGVGIVAFDAAVAKAALQA